MDVPGSSVPMVNPSRFTDSSVAQRQEALFVFSRHQKLLLPGRWGRAWDKPPRMAAVRRCRFTLTLAAQILESVSPSRAVTISCGCVCWGHLCCWLQEYLADGLCTGAVRQRDKPVGEADFQLCRGFGKHWAVQPSQDAGVCLGVPGTSPGLPWGAVLHR